jgi:hypothetical protein
MNMKDLAILMIFKALFREPLKAYTIAFSNIHMILCPAPVSTVCLFFAPDPPRPMRDFQNSSLHLLHVYRTLYQHI